MNRSRARRAVRAVTSRVVGIGYRSPSLVLRGGDLLAPAVGPLVRSPSPDQLRFFFPELTQKELEDFRLRMLREFVRGQILANWVRRRGRSGIRHLLSRVPPPPGRMPAILGTFHIGPLHALGAAFEDPAMPPLLALRGGDDSSSNSGPLDQQRAARLHRAAEWLRKGGNVLMALDPQHATRIPVPFFGGKLHLARGGFALARITGAPIIPVVARWIGSSIDVVVGEPLSTGAGDVPVEEALARSAARWLENHLRANPREISLRILDLTER